MGRAKSTRKTRKAAILRPTDARVQLNVVKTPSKKSAEPRGNGTGNEIIERCEEPGSLFFSYNSELKPPYRVLMDTNFINFSIQNKVDIFKGLMDLLYAKVIPVITDCVVGELEKMGHRFRLALRIAKDPRIVRLSCSHKGTYADDCIVERIKQHRCYLVGTNDKDLQRRVRKVPGVPLVTVTQHKYAVERLPDAQLR